MNNLIADNKTTQNYSSAVCNNASGHSYDYQLFMSKQEE